jgi:probable enterotoxin B
MPKMNRKKIYKLLVATSTVVTTMSMATDYDYVYAAEDKNVQAIKNVYAARTQNIMGESEISQNSIKNFFNSLNIKDYKLSVSIDEFINIAYEEASMEGVRGDIVVAQAFLETGYFKYGDGKGIVQPEDNNFAGIGATGQANLRNTFKDVREGLRAQVQHLKAYASTAPLNNTVIDPRFKYVTRGSAKTLAELNGKWAYPGYNTKNYTSLEAAFEAGDTYGQKIYSIIQRASNFNNTVSESKSQLLAAKGQVINVSTNLRIRQLPSTDSVVLGYIASNQTFNIKDKSQDWYNIEFNGITGYVHKDYVKEIIANIPIPSVTGNELTKLSYSVNTSEQGLLKGQVINVSSNLRIRQAPNINSAIIGYLVNGQTFTIKEKNGDWYNIECGDKVGYINKNYVKELNTAVTTESDNKNQVTTIDIPKQLANITSNTNTNTNTDKQEKTSKGQVINISTNLRIRQGASSNTAIVGYLINGQTFTIKGQNGDWYNIQWDNKTGYVFKDYVKVIEDNPSTEATKTETSKPQINELGTIYNVSSNLRLRSKPSTDSNSTTLAYILPGQTFTILGLSGDWYNINYNGKVGYVNKYYVKKVDTSTNSSTTNSSNTSSSTVNTSKVFDTVFSSLKAQIGSPYVFGGAGELLTSSLLDKLKQTFPAQAQQGIYDLAEKNVNKGYRAFDCSGFLQWGFKQAGITIGRTTWDQINNGVEVSLKDIKPGDILFYNDIQHVGMYIGDGKWIDAPNSRTTIKISEVPWSKIGRARRIIN